MFLYEKNVYVYRVFFPHFVEILLTIDCRYVMLDIEYSCSSCHPFYILLYSDELSKPCSADDCLWKTLDLLILNNSPTQRIENIETAATRQATID